MSERRACRLMTLQRSTKQYQSQPDKDEPLRTRMRELAEERPRWGAPFLHAVLRREGCVVNHKRTERVYQELGLSLRRRKRRKRPSHLRVVMAEPSRPNERWSMDFIFDQMLTGRRMKCLSIGDDFTREALVLEAAHSLTGDDLADILDRLIEGRSAPVSIVCDNGPEFTSAALDRWAHKAAVKLDFITPGKPVQNAFRESFLGKFRNECLNQHLFHDLNDARRKIESWRIDYSENRPHSSLNYETPNTVARRHCA